MPRLVHRLYVATIACALVAPLVCSPTNGQVLVAPVVDRMGKAFASIRSLRAEMSQQKTYAQLGMSDPVERGVLYLKKKNERAIQVRLEINSPEQRIITMKDNQFVLFQPRINQAIEGRVDAYSGSARAAAGFFTYLFGGVAQASRDYNIAVVGDEPVGSRRTTHMRLTPRPDHRGLYREVDLWVDNENWLPTQQRFVEANRDVTIVQLLDVRTNVPVEDHLFMQKLPANTQHVRS